MITDISYDDMNFLKMYHILVYICDDCNYSCKYCYNKKPRSLKQIDLTCLQLFILELHKNIQKKIDLELIGGEPTMHKGLYDFCKSTIQDGISINIYTNFSQSVEFYQKLLDIGVNLYISWHSQNQFFIDKLKSLKKYYAQLYVSVMYENENTNLALYVFDSIKSNVKKCLTLIDANQRLYDDKQLNEYFSRTYDNEKKYKVNSSNIVSSYVSEEFLVNNKLNKFKNWKCNALKEGIYIHFNGNIYPCQNYMTNDSKCLTNIYCQDALYFISFHSVICPFDYCECGFSFTKSKKII